MISALQKTLDDSEKFDRFAAQVLKHPDSPVSREVLKKQLAAEIEQRVGYNKRNFPGYDPQQPAPPPADYARLDAFGAIMNEAYYHAAEIPRQSHRDEPDRQRPGQLSVPLGYARAEPRAVDRPAERRPLLARAERRRGHRCLRRLSRSRTSS